MPLRFRRALVTLFLSRKPQLSCVVCGRPVPLKEFQGEVRLQCAECGAHLVLTLGYNWLYTTICVAGGFIAAYLQGIFAVGKLRHAGDFAGYGDEDEELRLEKALPRPAGETAAELEVDPEDPEDAPPAASPSTAPPAPGKSGWWRRLVDFLLRR